MTIQTQFSTDPNSIVTVNVSIVEAPTPITYQRMGALVCYGATTAAANSTSMLTQYSDLTPILIQPITASTATWAAGVVTVTTPSALAGGLATAGDTYNMVLTGFTPAAYNGFYTITVTGSNTFTYPLVSNPGAVTTMGQYQPHKAIELSQMANTYFAQGNVQAVYVLELGYQHNFANRVTILQNWLNNNPRTIYNFLLPREFGTATNLPNALPLFATYASPEAMEYFWVTLTTSTLTTIPDTDKCVVQFIEDPSITSTTGVNLTTAQGEFSAAAMFYNALAFRPSNTNRIAPMAFKYVYGVTPYTQIGNGPLLVSFKQAAVNYVTTGAEGGIAFTMIYEGVTADFEDFFNWWYTIDWVQIQVNLDLSNAIINGSNNPLAPLYYNQDGITYLETVLFGTMQDAQTFGMVLGKIKMTQYDGPDLTNAIQGGEFAGQCNVNAVPFLNYTLANPGDYKIGEYDGLSTLFIPARGFIHILVNVVASNLIAI